MELLFVLGIVVAIIAILYIQRKKDQSTVETTFETPALGVEAAPVAVVLETTTPAPIVVETTTPAPVAVVEPAPVVVEETVAIIDEPPAVEKPAAKPKRAKVNGKFVKDDPATPENDAWEGGVAPPKKVKAKAVVADDSAADAVKSPRKPRSKKV
jgi:hypothetical protein